MKTIIILGDGMADTPIEKLGGRTVLQAARKPHIDRLAALGRSGMLKTVPDELPAGSEVANLAVLGYDVRAVYEGRGVLEGAAMGVELGPDDLAMRCNLVCLDGDRLKNHSAGHITTDEGRALISAVQEVLGRDGVSFHPGVSYRHLLVVRGGVNELKLTPPHDVPGAPWRDVLPAATGPAGEQTAALLRDLIVRSQAFLADHPINRARVAAGKDPGNSLWPWSAGRRPRMKTYQELYGRTGAVISAVDLLHGIGKYAGFRVIHVPGATGLYDTNYEGKVAAALEAIRDVDLVYLHIEAADEAGHEGNVHLKLQCVEALDARVVKPIFEATAAMDEPVALAVLPDHPTPCALRTHTHDPVPFLIYKPGVAPDAVETYDEDAAAAGFFGLLQGDEFIRALFAD